MVKGELLYKNGDSYYGQLKNGGQISGQGVYKFSNGSVYEGYFQNSQFHGRGKLLDQFNSITIIANFQKGKANGQGKIIYEDQSIYEGELKDGLRNGKGRYIYSNKESESQYNGQFVNDQFEGEGILTFKNGDLCKGSFRNSLLNGFGQFRTKDIYITGEFKDSLPHGKAKAKYSNSQTYEGDFQQGKKQGHGVYTYKDGTTFKGNFINDLRQGPGEIIFATGQIFKGKFLHDLPADGSFQKQKWTIQGPLHNNEFNGYCHIQGQGLNMSVDYTEGKKDGFLTMVKKNSQGKQISFKSSFRKGKQDSCSISYSERF